MFSIKSQKCQEPPRTDKSQTPTNADLQSTYYSTLSTKLDTPRRTLPTIRGRRCSRRMAHSDYFLCVFQKYLNPRVGCMRCPVGRTEKNLLLSNTCNTVTLGPRALLSYTLHALPRGLSRENYILR